MTQLAECSRTHALPFDIGRPYLGAVPKFNIGSPYNMILEDALSIELDMCGAVPDHTQ